MIKNFKCKHTQALYEGNSPKKFRTFQAQAERKLQMLDKVFTYSEARQKLSTVLDMARSEEVVIKRRGGEMFTVIFKPMQKSSPFDVPGIKTKASTDLIRLLNKPGQNAPGFPYL
jgi:hypothetical protein